MEPQSVQTIQSSVLSQAQADGLIMFSPAQMIQRVAIIDEIRRNVMQVNTDYYSLQEREVVDPESGEKQKIPQYSLSKAGSEKLCLAFGLSSELESSVVIDNPNEKREISVPVWVVDPTRPGKSKKEWIQQTVIGVYEVKSTCSIYSSSGVRLAKASGSCSNQESSFRSTPYADAKNPILKRAEKRALVAAALIATASSGMFTQDLEDLLGDEHPTAGAQYQTPNASSGNSAATGWLSEGQQKLLFAKSKQQDPPVAKEMVEYLIQRLNKEGAVKGRPIFKLIADEKDGAKAYWDIARKGASQDSSESTAPPPAGDKAAVPGPPPPSDESGF